MDGRAAPLFGLLFGYGLVQMTRRHSGQGQDPAGARQLLRRRGTWLIVFGAVHVVLLYAGDVIGVYGVVALVLAGAVSWSGRRLWSVAAAALAVGGVVHAAVLLVGAFDAPLPVASNLLGSALLRVTALRRCRFPPRPLRPRS